MGERGELWRELFGHQGADGASCLLVRCNRITCDGNIIVAYKVLEYAPEIINPLPLKEGGLGKCLSLCGESSCGVLLCRTERTQIAPKFWRPSVSTSIILLCRTERTQIAPKFWRPRFQNTVEVINISLRGLSNVLLRARRVWWGPSKFVACPLPSCWQGEGPEVRRESPRIITCLKDPRARFEAFREASWGVGPCASEKTECVQLASCFAGPTVLK